MDIIQLGRNGILLCSTWYSSGETVSCFARHGTARETNQKFWDNEYYTTAELLNVKMRYYCKLTNVN